MHVKIYATEPMTGRAEVLAEQLNMELTTERPDEAYLQLDENGAALVSGKQELRGDFSGMLKRVRPNNLNGEIIVRAAKIKNLPMPLTVVDATAGMGEDSFLLAAAGFEVHLFEYNPVIATLLEDALERAKEDPALAEIAVRMHFHRGDSRDGLRNLGFLPDVVLLDPMFPARQKSGLVKKKLQMIQTLEIPCGDEESMVDAAIAADPRKIIIKRPTKAPHLAGRKPSYAITGKIIRYDCLILPRMQEE